MFRAEGRERRGQRRGRNLTERQGAGRRVPLLRLVAAAGVVVGAASFLVSPPASTLAQWSDAEYGTAAATALTVPTPVLTGCLASGGALGLNPTVTVTWSLPPGYYPSTAVSFGVGTNSLGSLIALGSGVSTSGPSAGVFTTVYSSGLLSGLLGGTFTVGLWGTYNGWTSKQVGYTASIGLAGLGTTCTLINSP